MCGYDYTECETSKPAAAALTTNVCKQVSTYVTTKFHNHPMARKRHLHKYARTKRKNKYPKSHGYGKQIAKQLPLNTMVSKTFNAMSTKVLKSF